MLSPGQFFLVLKYSLEYEPRCIALHQETIEKYGYCWFGKVGKFPSSSVIEKIMNEEKAALVLYRKGNIYLCSLEEVSYSQITEGVPDYYSELKIRPSIYFKLSSIKPVELDLIEDAVVCSSGKKLKDALPRTMASYTLYQFPGENTDKTKRSDTKSWKATTKNLTGECRYKRDGICYRKGFVNYQYDCERPGSCSGFM